MITLLIILSTCLLSCTSVNTPNVITITTEIDTVVIVPVFTEIDSVVIAEEIQDPFIVPINQDSIDRVEFVRDSSN